MAIVIDNFGPVMQLTLDRPGAANAVNVETALQIAAAIDDFATQDSARVLIVTGAGERSFCAGGDLEQMLDLTGHAQADRAGPLGFARLDPGKPTIAAINGHCFGGGLELASWCDFRIAAENAEFGVLNRQWGLPFVDGGTQRLPRIVGYGNAMWMINTGYRFGADRAFQLGLVQEVVPAGQALTRAREIAEHMARQPQPALLADRQAVVAGRDLPLPDGITAEAEIGRPVMSHPDVAKRLADYVKRRK